MVAGRLWLFPTFTTPKLRLLGATVTTPGFVLFCVVADLFELVSPWHPTIVARASTTNGQFQRVGSGFIIDAPVPPFHYRPAAAKKIV
jgi:fucose permease